MLVDGASVGAVTSYTFSNVIANHTISATFTTARKIRASAGSNGSISPSGVVGVASGANQTFTIIPAANYKINTVKVDGKSIGKAGSYTFENIEANHTIVATFGPSGHNIWAFLQGGGSISPSGAVSVASGANQTFTITPAADSQLAYVLIDGESVSSNGGELNGLPATGKSVRMVNYQFANVSSEHTICAVFTKMSPPVADAGPDQAVESSSMVTLNGSNSTDSVSGIVSYRWTQAAGPRVKLSNPSAPICTFRAPNITSGKVLAFNLEVANKAGISGGANCLVNVSGTDKAPSANAGGNQTVNSYTNVTLDGSGSSGPDGSIASYRWAQIEGPAVDIINANTSHASFVAPDPGALGATLVFQLQVSDNSGLTTRDQCTVNVVTVDQPPFAHAGPDQTVAAKSYVTLDGSGSYDPVSSTDSYRWKQIRGTPVTLSDPTAKAPIFTAPTGSDAQGADLLFLLTVTDAKDQLSATAKCAVTVTP